MKTALFCALVALSIVAVAMFTKGSYFGPWLSLLALGGFLALICASNRLRAWMDVHWPENEELPHSIEEEAFEAPTLKRVPGLSRAQLVVMADGDPAVLEAYDYLKEKERKAA